MTKLSNRQAAAAILGSVLLALGLGSGLKLWLTRSAVQRQDSEGSAAVNQQTFQQPFLSATEGLQLANPLLLKSTSTETRLTTIASGRLDPFAPVTVLTPLSQAADSTEPQRQLTSFDAPPTLHSLPVIPVTSTQALPPLPNISSAPLPGLGISAPGAAAPTVEIAPLPLLPQSPVDGIEISGVAQVGDNVRAIIREAGASTSRHVQAGDLLADGQVRVKRIDLSNSEPMVVLEYNGEEFYRSVGSTALVSLL